MESKPKKQMSSLAAALAAIPIKDDSKVRSTNKNTNNVDSYHSTSDNAPKSSLAAYQLKPKLNDNVPNNIPSKGRNGDNNNNNNNKQKNDTKSLPRGGRNSNKESGSGDRGNRGKGGRGHQQGRGSHHHQQQKHDTKAKSRSKNVETISFEFDIDTMVDDSQSCSSSQNESSQRQKIRNNYSASGGRILDMRASRRLIDSALGRSRNNTSKKTSNNSIVESKKNESSSTRKQPSDDKMNIQSFEASKAIKDLDQSNESRNQIEKFTNKVVLINEKVQGSKKPVKNWADDDDGDY